MRYTPDLDTFFQATKYKSLEEACKIYNSLRGGHPPDWREDGGEAT
jgi:hypothetical protein